MPWGLPFFVIGGSTIVIIDITILQFTVTAVPLPIIDLSNSSDWVLVNENTLEAYQPIANNPLYYPIPDYKIPVNIDKHTLVIGSTSSKTKPTWRLAFYVSMLIRIPGIGQSEFYNTRVNLGLQLVRFPPISSSYVLRLRIPRWHREMVFSIWKYVGIESDVIDIVTEIQNQPSP